MDDINDGDGEIKDNQQLLDNMIKEEKNAKAHKKKIMIITISLILASIILISTFIIIYFTLIKKKDYDTTPIIIEPIDNYKYCLILIHGLNDSAENLKTKFDTLNFAQKNSTKIIFLKAPIKDVTYKNLKHVTSWYDYFFFPMNSTDSYNFEDAIKSRDIIKETIDNEAKLLNNSFDRIIIGGHSQGACMSLFIGYTIENLLGGVISLSGALFEEANITENKDNLKVFLYHGVQDKLIPLEYHNKTIERILKYKNSIQRFYFEEETHYLKIFKEKIMYLEDFLNHIFI